MNKIKNKNTIHKMNKHPSKIMVKYPHHSDDQFQKRITLKKEFQYKYDGSAKDILEEDKKNNLCNYTEFTLAPHQEFVKNFISHKTAYNGILLYHGMGSGKTCSAIGITEEYRKINKYNEQFKKIIIIASPNVQENFKLQLFDKSKLKKENNIWNLGGCVGSSLLYELKDYDIDNMSHEQIVQKIDKIIKTKYSFMGYEKFANRIDKVTQIEINGENKKKYIKKKLQHMFEGCMIVVDEVHNIRMIGDKTNKKIATNFLKLVQNVKKMKLVFLSGTPMYNDPKEILFLINLLNMNDGNKILYNKEVFDKNGNFVKNGEKRLIEKANGYISYVRGENPYSFPFKIYPEVFELEHSIKSIPYPRSQFNNKPISTPIQHLDLYVNKMNDIQMQGYLQSIQNIYDKLGEKEIEKFENMDSFGYNLLQEPLYSLNICYQKKEGNEVKYYTGKSGLDEVVQCEQNKTKFEYISDEERIFYKDNIGKYSCKIRAILNHILDSKGIILIYSQVLDGGLVPLALALEELGFNRAKRDNLWKKSSHIEPINAYTMKHDKGKSKDFKQAKYALISGDVDYSPNNNEELSLLNNENNINGELCKVVLISQAGSEGLDFKNLRQVHIMEPWYNLNRIEQIVGRAIRNCSHKQLPLQERNCQIFLHSTILPESTECADMMIYRYAEQKSMKIGLVQKVLKSISVDCLLNHEQLNFSKLQQIIPITLSSGKQIKHDIKDKPYSSICDYMPSCEYKCANIINSENSINSTTFGYDNIIIANVIDKVKSLFRQKHFYNKEEIIKLLLKLNHTIESINYSLMFLVSNDNEFVVDKYNRKGRVVNIGDLYIFSPIELEDEKLYTQDIKTPLYHEIKELKINGEKVISKDKKDKSKANNIPQSVHEKTKTNHIYANIVLRFQQGLIVQEGNLKSVLDFYQLYGKTIETLKLIDKDITINNNTSKLFLFEHILEELSFDDTLSLINFVYIQQELEFQDYILGYFNQFVFEFDIEEGEKMKIILLPKMDEKEVKEQFMPSKIKLYIYKQDKWIPINRIELSKIGHLNIKQALETFSQKRLFKHIGFYDFNKGNMVFKTKDTTTKSKKNKGAMFTQKSPKLMKPIINELFGKEHFKDKKTPYNLNKEQLAIICETMMKLNNLNSKTGEKYYLNKVEACLN
jgi:hypothetical protein